MPTNALIFCKVCGTAIEAKVEIAFLGNRNLLVTGRCDGFQEEREAQVRLPGIWLLSPKQAEVPRITITFTKE